MIASPELQRMESLLSSRWLKLGFVIDRPLMSCGRSYLTVQPRCTEFYSCKFLSSGHGGMLIDTKRVNSDVVLKMQPCISVLPIPNQFAWVEALFVKC
ncbi:hypothetical protein BDDG_11685 [Blastomyces dermatitidis ATCC 18188]|uniref:Uncharacterized protein n=1 Tax=Ajellomyces dermatitidis (strain ATCC 18188 / CBS 674.68) TaxID=653446 RepID=A0A0J9EKP8_AJEDA|nr:hypothetical protein BDDG_11685 [Blastomyces dermatitidis ATCC 18188]